MVETKVAGLIGFGALGTVAGAALKREGYRVMAYDPSPAAQVEMKSLGVDVAAGPAEVGRACDVVAVFVLDADQARAVLLGPDGVFGVMSKGVVLLQSTVGPEAARDIAGRCPVGITFFDAPVTVRRSTPPTFFCLIAGAQAPDPAIRKLLDSYCHDMAFVGPVGAGQAAKLVNNVMSIVNTAVATEALQLADAFGIDRETMIRLASNGSGSSHALSTWDIRKTLFEGVPADDSRITSKKDLSAALQSAGAAGVQMPMTTRALDLLVK